MNDAMILILIMGGVAVIGSAIGVMIHSKRRAKSRIDISALKNAIGHDNIESVYFQRSKIVVSVKNPRDVDLTAIKATGAIGINVVGKKIKFYYERDNEAIVDALTRDEGSGSS